MIAILYPEVDTDALPILEKARQIHARLLCVSHTERKHFIKVKKTPSPICCALGDLHKAAAHRLAKPFQVWAKRRCRLLGTESR